MDLKVGSRLELFSRLIKIIFTTESCFGFVSADVEASVLGAPLDGAKVTGQRQSWQRRGLFWRPLHLCFACGSVWGRKAVACLVECYVASLGRFQSFDACFGWLLSGV